MWYCKFQHDPSDRQSSGVLFQRWNESENIYFDSFGQIALEEIQKYLKKTRKIIKLEKLLFSETQTLFNL